MIITVTMNPAIDKTVEESVHLDGGGKGINVSKTIVELGGETISLAILGAENKKDFIELFDEYQINLSYVETSGRTRVNTKIVEADGTVTERNEKGPTISKMELDEFKGLILKHANKNTWFVLSGSVPVGVPTTIYKDVIELLHEKGAKVFLDADGELFRYGIEAKPDAIKPNQMELQRYLGVEGELTFEEMIEAGHTFLNKNISYIIFSLGEKGACFISKEEMLHLPGISVSSCSTVGAGDAMVAAFCYGLEQGISFKECAKLAIATSAGAVETVGTRPPKKERVEELYSRITS